MKNHVVLHIPTYTEEDSAFPKPLHGNYDYWVPLLNHFLEKSDSVEIHCWNEERDAIEEFQRLFQSFEMNVEEYMTIFKGKKSSAMANYLADNYMKNNGEFKWFTVNLDMGIVSVFHSSHWATEFFIPDPTEQEIEFIKRHMPAETDFHHY